jgi:hypothetical protein
MVAFPAHPISSTIKGGSPVYSISALPPTADICSATAHVR